MHFGTLPVSEGIFTRILGTKLQNFVTCFKRLSFLVNGQKRAYDSGHRKCNLLRHGMKENTAGVTQQSTQKANFLAAQAARSCE